MLLKRPLLNSYKTIFNMERNWIKDCMRYKHIEDQIKLGRLEIAAILLLGVRMREIRAKRDTSYL
jgi:hypothetical protein